MGDGLPPEEGETDPYEGSTIEWQIESGEGGSLSETTTTVEDGLTAVTLSTSTVADTTYEVKARLKTFGSGGADLGDAASWLYTEEIKVVPGATASIELVQDKTAVKSDATDTVEVTATSDDGSTSTQSFTVNLTDDTSEAQVGAISDSNAAANQVSESAANGTAVGVSALATDADATDDVSYSLTDDAGGRF